VDDYRDSARDVLPNARGAFVEPSVVRGDVDSQFMKDASPTGLKPQRRKFSLQRVNMRKSQRVPGRISREEGLYEFGNNRRTGPLEEYLGDRDPVGICPVTPDELTAVFLEPVSDVGTDPYGRNRFGRPDCGVHFAIGEGP
jgi:hypothetical protein